MHGTQKLLTTVLLLLMPALALADYDVMLPMEVTTSGNYSVVGKVGGDVDATFLIDTGASLSTMSRALFEKIKSNREVSYVRKIAARLANGKYQTAKVYRISNFLIGNQCEIEAIEVAVMPHHGRNILGMNALAMTAPFGLDPQKMALTVSRCRSDLIDKESAVAVAH